MTIITMMEILAAKITMNDMVVRRLPPRKIVPKTNPNPNPNQGKLTLTFNRFYIFCRLKRKLRMLLKVIVTFWLVTSMSLLYVRIFFSPLSITRFGLVSTNRGIELLKVKHSYSAPTYCS